MNKCKNCGKKIESRRVYCSHECQHQFQYKEYIIRWKNGEEGGMKGDYGISKNIRTYLFDKYNHKCTRCGWGETNPFTGNVPLEVEHIDGNHKNNDESNLDLLCPNCHSLTSTYKGANLGNGRSGRQKYYETKKYFCIDCGVELRSHGDRCVDCSNLQKRKNDRPSKDELLQLIKTTPLVRIGKLYGVSDNAIRKWCKSYDLPTKKKDIALL